MKATLKISNTLWCMDTRRLKTPSGRRHKMTPAEERFLRVLLIHNGCIVTWDKITKYVCGSTKYTDRRTTQVYVTWLRRALADDPDISIVSVHGHGYKLYSK